MRSIDLPTLDEAALFDRLWKRMGASVDSSMRNARDEVLAAYHSYRAGGVHLLTTIISDDKVGSELKKNYRILRYKAEKHVGDQILARSATCCLCGFRASSELDHYLPKTKYPEFSALTINLVPVCGVCNKKKLETYVTKSGGPAFVHAYFSDLPSRDIFLECELMCSTAILPIFELVQPVGMSDETFSALQSQFEFFDLATIYSEQATEFLCDRKLSIEEFNKEGGQSTVEKYLRREARSLESRRGCNDWKVATLMASANSTEFCRGGFALL